MTKGIGNKKYEQPYSSRHVIHNSYDSIRAYEPAYIKNFPRFLHTLYKKQTPFSSNLLANVRPLSEQLTRQEPLQRSTSKKSVTADNSPQRVSSATTSPTSAMKLAKKQTGFKTITRSTKSPAAMSAMPSDFEHIFHYSETQ